jgi:preprotein translocase subunit SecF
MAMLIGIIVGTYSSVYIASPLTIWLDQRAAKKAAAGRSVKVRPASPGGAPAR